MPRTRLTRLPEKTVEDRTTLDAVLDEALVCHIGLVVDDHPVVIPTAIARDGDRVLVHGSTGSRWMRALATGVPASVAVTLVDGLVIARSTFEASVHYRSAVLFGSFSLVSATEREPTLDLLVDDLLPGRAAEVRRPTTKELAATQVLAMPIETWSLKVSAGWPEDPAEDIAGPAWAGVVPLHVQAGAALPAPDLAEGIEVAPSVRAMEGRPYRSRSAGSGDAE